MRFVADANATAARVFVSFGTIVDVPPGGGACLGPSLRVSWASRPSWALSLEGEQLEHPFSPGWSVRRRSSLGPVLTARF